MKTGPSRKFYWISAVAIVSINSLFAFAAWESVQPWGTSYGGTLERIGDWAYVHE